MRITIYCASSENIDAKYFQAAEKLAHILLKADVEVIFGGGSSGLMGRIADIYVANQGKILGIMPHFMKEIEWAHPAVERFIFTETMNERKDKLIEQTDAILTLAGGTGTLEELFDVITRKRLGLFTKPIVILNTDNYYSALNEMLQTCVTENFMVPQHLSMWDFITDPSEVLPAIASAQEWNEEAINYAIPK